VKVPGFDILYISKHFDDVAEWWTNEGKKIHPLLAIAIAIAITPILSLPASNRHQERTTFNVCHFNLKDVRFEMSMFS
jgi:hypothetical protein